MKSSFYRSIAKQTNTTLFILFKFRVDRVIKSPNNTGWYALGIVGLTAGAAAIGMLLLDEE